jgi:hypothetical protein
MTGTKPPKGIVCGDTAPSAIARSAPFTVVANADAPLPSGPDADPAQIVYDRFDGGAFTGKTVTDPVGGRASFTLTTPMAKWQVKFTDVDLNATSAFVADHHYMDVIYDGGTATRTNVIHNNHAVITLSPSQTVDFSGGRILHVTFEVDGQFDGRRWTGFNLAPAGDPLTNWYNFNGPVNKTNQALFVQIFGDHVTRDVMSPDPKNPTGTPIDTGLGHWPNGLRYNPYRGGAYQSGRGLDNRSRFDIFLSETRIMVFEDGRTISQDLFPKPLSYAGAARIYFPHYLYHTGNELPELLAYARYKSFWINDVPYSDERHWNNMGFEVLPAATPWSAIPGRIKLPPKVAPQWVAGG